MLPMIGVWLHQWAPMVASLPLFGALAAEPPAVVDVGSRLELMVDDALIERLDGGAGLLLHHPVPAEIVMVHDEPWEGSGSGYHSIFHDGERYRMCYKAWQLTLTDGKLVTPRPPIACYAESDDGIHWRKPDLGLFEFQGSRHNNIVLMPGRYGKVDADPGHIAVFLDENPRCAADARYKAIVRSSKPNGLIPFRSPDGIHWSPMSDAPVITKGAFDSQNLAFWDPIHGEYRAYYRYFDNGVRGILTATSPDFVHWSEGVPLQYPDAPTEHLYTNQVKPYYRAPHILVGFPTRYVERGWSAAMRSLPEAEHRAERARAHPRYGMALTDALLMTSRDGVTFRRWGESFLRPGPERPGTWNYGQQYLAWQMVETPSSLAGAPRELSLYATESYWTGESSELRRYTLRVDGFVSAHATLAGGEVLTKPLRFEGDRLLLNLATSAAGSIRVEVQDVNGRPVPGFALADCEETFGDSLERAVMWKGGSLHPLAGTPIRLRFVLKDADLYAWRFGN